MTDTQNPMFVDLRSSGAMAYTGGATIQLSVDSRIWRIDGVTVDDVSLGSASTSTSGNLTTYTWPLGVTIAAATVRVRAAVENVAVYPDDNVNDALGSTWVLAGTGADSTWPLPNGATTPAAPFGGTVTAVPAIRTLGEHDFRVIESMTVTSVGPNAIPAGSIVTAMVSSQAAYDATATATVGGTAVGLTPLDVVYDTGARGFPFRVDAEIPAGSAVVVNFTYGSGFASPAEYGARAYWSSATADFHNQRHTGQTEALFPL